MKGLTLNSMPAGIMASPMATGAVQSPIKKRRKKQTMMNASASAKSGMSGIGMPQMPFGGALNK